MSVAQDRGKAGSLKLEEEIVRLIRLGVSSRRHLVPSLTKYFPGHSTESVGASVDAAIKRLRKAGRIRALTRAGGWEVLS